MIELIISWLIGIGLTVLFLSSPFIWDRLNRKENDIINKSPLHSFSNVKD